MTRSCPSWSYLLVHHPLVTTSVTLAVALALALQVILSGEFKLSDNGDRDFAVKYDSVNRDRWALEEAEEAVVAGTSVTQAERSSVVDDYNFMVMYRDTTGAGKVATRENFAYMLQLEQKLRQDRDWSELCFLGQQSACAPEAYLSFPAYIGFNASWTQQQVNQAVAGAAYEIAAGTRVGRSLAFFFGSDLTPASAKSAWMRSLLQFGGPLAGYKNVNDDKDGQDDEFAGLAGRWDDILRSSATGTQAMDVQYYGRESFQLVVREQIRKDLMWAFGAMAFVFVYMCGHFKSLFLGLAAILQVALAFPVSFFFYSNVAGIHLFQTIHIISVFLVLGLAADDSFLVFDAWKQSVAFPHLAAESMLQQRMSYTWKRASKAMMITSFTTAAAFTTTTRSGLSPIASFGAWSAILIIINFILAVTYFPGCVVIYHRYLERCPFLGCCCWGRCTRCSKVTQPPAETELAVPAPPVTQSSSVALSASSVIPSDSNKPQEANFDADADADADAESDEDSAEKQNHELDHFADQLGLTERVFLAYSPYLYRARYFVVAFFLVVIAVSIYMAVQIKPLSEQENFMPSSHDVILMRDNARTRFFKTKLDRAVVVKIVFGVKGIDMSGTDRFDPDDVGNVEWDTTFNLADPAAQEYLLSVCADLRASPLVYNGLTTCFLEDFAFWAEANVAGGFPVAANLSQSLQEFAQYALATNGTDYVGDFNIGIDRGTGELRFVVLEAVSPLAPFQPYAITKPVYDKWSAYVDAIREDPAAPATANKPLQTALVFWSVMITEKELLNNALSGTAVMGVVVLGALLVATLNIWVSLFAFIGVVGIVASVMAVVYLQGWELGIAVSVGVVILFGLSVDHTIHIGHTFHESLHEHRYGKTREATVKMGVSVVGGALTTLGAATFMFACVVVFFNKFAVLMSCTVSFAMIFALVFLPALLFIAGPEHQAGDVTALLRCCGRSRSRQQ